MCSVVSERISKWLSPQKHSDKDSDENAVVVAHHDSDWERLGALASSSSGSTLLSAFALGSVSALASRKIYVRHFKRITHAGWVNPDMILQKRWLKGVVVR